METAAQLRKLLSDWADGDNQALGSIIVVVMQDLITRREAEESKAVAAEAEALSARVYAECMHSTMTNIAGSTVTLTHRPTGLVAASDRGRDAALDSLIGMLRNLGAI
jgi:hypothetical protein